MITLLNRLSVLVCILLILGAPAGGLVASAADEASDRVLRAGAAAADITPPLGERVVGGFEPFPSTTIHDNLYARCLVLDNGEAQIAFVICDNLGIVRDIFDEARERIAKETNLPPLNILMAATHTHSGTRARSDKYRPVVVRGIVEAVRGALANLEPAKIGWGGIDEPSEVFNRRWFVSDPDRRKNPFGGVDKVRMNPGQNHPSLIKPAGPVDPEISVLSVQATDGRPIALLANYSLHYVGGVNKGEISADYFGIFSRRIGELLGAQSVKPPFVRMLTNGTSGDVNNIHFGHKPKRYERYERMNEVAELVAKRVKEACGRIEYRHWVALGSKHRDVTLKFRKPDEKMREYFSGVMAKPEDAPKYHHRERNYAARVQRLFEGPDEVTIPLQAVRIGDLGVTAIPFEVLTEIGLEIKEKTPFGDTFTIELANDYHGYLPTPQQHELGGYETWMGTCKVQEDASVVIVDQLLAMLAELASEKRGR